MVVFSKEWFKRKQRSLLFLLNNPITKPVMRAILDIECNEPIISITPFEYHCDLGKGKRRMEIHIARKYGIRLYMKMHLFWQLCHNFDMFFANKYCPKFNLGFDTLTSYPNAHPETTTVDGVILSWASKSFSDHRSSTSGIVTGDSNADDYSIRIAATTTTDMFQGLSRVFLLFDASTLPVGASVTSAIISITGTGKYNLSTLPNGGVSVYSSSPASDTGLVSTDFDNVGSIPYSNNILFGSLPDWLQVGDFTLNATGLASIAPGILKYSLRESYYDVGGNQPAWSSGREAYWQSYFSDYTGANNARDPKMVITYTSGAGASAYVPKIMVH